MTKTQDQYNKQCNWSLNVFLHISFLKQIEQVICFTMVTFYFVINF